MTKNCDNCQAPVKDTPACKRWRAQFEKRFEYCKLREPLDQLKQTAGIITEGA